MRRKILRLISKEDDKAIEGEFGPHGVLFLESARGGLKFSSHPDLCGLVCAAFVSKRASVYGAALNSAATMGDKRGFNRVKNGDVIQIGLSRFFFSIGADNSGRSLIRRRYLACIAAAAVLAGAVFASMRALKSVGTSGTVRVQERANSFGRGAGGESVGALVEEARVFLREGRVGQARLSLAEALDLKPDDENAAKLLEDIDKDNEVMRGASGRASGGSAASGVPRVEDADVLFREGQKLESAGDFSNALSKFNRAVEIVKAQDVSPVFAAPLEDARDAAVLKLRAGMSPYLAKIDDLLKSVKSLDASAAVSKLLSAKSEIGSLVSALPEDPQVLKVKREYEESLSAAAERWIAAAQAAERFSGCAKALPIYEAIFSELNGIRPLTAERAGEGTKRCR